MKINRLIFAGLLGVMGFSCSSHVDFGEQYRKIVYIVKSDNKVYTMPHQIAPEMQEAAVSLYCGGSDVLKENVQVTLVQDREAMAEYNAKNFDATNEYQKLIMLPERFYEIPDYSVTIESGKEYGKLPIRLLTKGLNPDTCYAIPLTIKETSHYEVNEKLKTVFYKIELVNNYSGTFVGTLMNIKGKDTTFMAKDKVLKAMEENQIRLPIYNLDGEYANLGTNFMLLTISADNSLTIVPWKDGWVEDLGGSRYIPERQTFELNYKCKDTKGNVLVIKEVLVNSEAKNEDEEV